MKRFVLIMVLLSGFMLACDDDEGPVVQPGNEFWMSDSEFIPSELYVTPGTLVRWVNNSNIQHTVTSVDGLFDEFLDLDQDFAFTFSEPGTFVFICTLHQGMTGTVVVE